MRLVNKHTLELEWFLEDQAPPYIILSHRWIGQETSLQDYTTRIQENGNDKEKVLKNCSNGVRKVVRLCQEVMSRPENYVWIDTCCIDKTSSAELQEAINSMHRLYQQATLCIVFMDDVELRDMEEQLVESRWFTRGWTLQELLAPSRQTFVDKDWNELGERTELADTISDITGISTACFGNLKEIYATPVATRFSWLSRRTTTRVEDMAYASLSLFNVNLTMLYGEGEKAFLRLQKEIISLYDDETIFLWSDKQGNNGKDEKNGEPDAYASKESLSTVLAPRPECFASCKGRKITKDVFFDRAPLQVTAKGLELETYDHEQCSFHDELSVALNCLVDGQRAGIFLQRVRDVNGGENLWRRAKTNRISTVKDYKTPPTREQLYLNHQRSTPLSRTRTVTFSTNLMEDRHLKEMLSRIVAGGQFPDLDGNTKFKIYIL